MISADSVILQTALLAVGILGTWKGADAMVGGTSLLSEKLGINRTVAGLTVIAMGTSLPELCVCLIAVFKGSADIATGNIVGSNISNICLIIGVGAVLFPIRVRQGLRGETAAALAFLGLLLFLCEDGKLERLEGLLVTAFLVPLAVYLYLRQAGKTDGKPEAESNPGESDPEIQGLGVTLFAVAAGIAALALGSNLVVESAVSIAHMAGVPELVIGATAVAVGTSLPELAASLAAVARREHSMAIGNLAGSNLFNIAILGLTSSILPLSIDPDMSGFQLPFAIVISALAVPFAGKGTTIGRGAGVFLLLLYGLFVYKIF